jgi:protein associated with RNAse G/E
MQCGPGFILLEVQFNLQNTPFMDTFLKKDDRFVDIFSSARWYNISQIHDREDDRVKGWHCNIGRPAILEGEDRLSNADQALNLWITRGGTQTVLDEDEFATVAELQNLFAENKDPDLIL